MPRPDPQRVHLSRGETKTDTNQYAINKNPGFQKSFVGTAPCCVVRPEQARKAGKGVCRR